MNGQGVLAILILLSSGMVRADYGMNTFGPDFVVDSKTEVLQVTNVPRTRTQDTIGLCYASVATTIFDEANCVAKRVADCSAVPDNERASMLDMSRYSQWVKDDDEAKLPESYDRGVREGGWATFAVRNAALLVESVAQEACAPFDQVVSKIDDPFKAYKQEKLMWDHLKKKYKESRKKGGGCSSCNLKFATSVGNELRKNFNIIATNQDILVAFGQETYEKFLDKLLIPEKCKEDYDWNNRVKLEGKWKEGVYPLSGEKSDYGKMIGKLKEVLARKRPIAIGFCTRTPLTATSQESCGEAKDRSESGMHAVVIKGYRRVCSTKKPSDCRDSIQLQNSWGEGWQKANDDGWVDAKELLDRTFYEEFAVSWLDPR